MTVGGILRRTYRAAKRRIQDRVLGIWPLATSRVDVRGNGNRIAVSNAARLLGCEIEIHGDDNRVEVAEGAVLNGVFFRIRGHGHRCVIASGCRINRGGEIWQEDAHTRISIGARTSIEAAHLAATEDHSEIEIGADCMFAYGIDIRTGDSHAIIDVASGTRLNPARSVRIRDRVWIAAHVCVLKGVELRADSVVGSGSVVTRSPGAEGVILVGNPARIARSGVRWQADRNA